MKRLTLNIGLRVDNFRSMYEESANPPGRFVPGHSSRSGATSRTGTTILAPRLSGAYDLFGNGRTALKASWSKYYERLTGGFANTYAPGVQTETRNWFDCDLNAARTACSGVVLPTNADDIAQDNEIGLERHVELRDDGERSRHGFRTSGGRETPRSPPRSRISFCRGCR